MTFTASLEQLAIRDALTTTSSNLMVIAVAGSGKTTTIVWVLPYIPDAMQKSILFMAFSKNIVSALEPRVPAWCSVKTGHALGLAAWKRHTGATFRGKAIDGEKTFALLKDVLRSRSDFDLYSAPVRRLIGFAKNAGMGTTLLENSFASWYHLISHNNIILDDAADERRLVEIAQETLERSVAKGREVIDFDDMLYLPLLHGASFDKKNYIFIDEAQDTNGVQRELIKRMLAAPPHGRLIAVGDPSQAIYGFRGADATAMQTMREEFQMKVLQLSVCHRCSQSVVEEARKYETAI